MDRSPSEFPAWAAIWALGVRHVAPASRARHSVQVSEPSGYGPERRTGGTVWSRFCSAFFRTTPSTRRFSSRWRETWASICQQISGATEWGV